MSLEDTWRRQNDPMARGYGALPILPFLMAGGLAVGAGIRRYVDSTNVNDIAWLASREMKLDTPVSKAQATAAPNAMLVGAANARESNYITAFWLHRVGRVALAQGDRAQSARLMREARELYSKASLMFGGSTDQSEIAAPFRYAQRQAAPYSYGIATVLERLAQPRATEFRQGAQRVTSLDQTIIQPGRQTAEDIGETARDTFELGGWLLENSWWLIPAAAVSYFGLVFLAARRRDARSR